MWQYMIVREMFVSHTFLHKNYIEISRAYKSIYNEVCNKQYLTVSKKSNTRNINSLAKSEWSFYFLELQMQNFQLRRIKSAESERHLSVADY